MRNQKRGSTSTSKGKQNGFELVADQSLRSQDQSLEKQKNGNGNGNGNKRFPNGLKGNHMRVQKTESNKKFGQNNFNFDDGLEVPETSYEPKEVTKTSTNVLAGGLGKNASVSGQKPTLNLRGLGTGGDLKKMIMQRMSNKISNLYQEKRTVPGELVKNRSVYNGNVPQGENPVPRLDSNDYAKRLRFEELKKTRLEALCNWKKHDHIGLKKNAYIKEIQKKNENILGITNKDSLERLEVQTDRFPLLGCRKAFWRVLITIRMVCKYIIETDLFSNLTISVILINSIYMMFDNPLEQNPPDWRRTVEAAFTYFYTIEAVLKIVGMGLIFNDGAYLHDPANLLDCFIVIMSYPSLLEARGFGEGFKQEVGVRKEEGGGLSLASLRAFRVLRPLRTISSIRGLRVLMGAIFVALPLLRDTIQILMFFFIMMAIGGSQLFRGILMKRCHNIETGAINPDDDMELCSSDQDCNDQHLEDPLPNPGWFCGKGSTNPNYGVTNFDNVLYAFLTVFQCVTLEGWSDIMIMVWSAYHPITVIYFLLIVLAGAFFLLNLTLAVINTAFNDANREAAMADANAAKDGMNPLAKDNELENAMNKKDQFSIAQYITAKIYVKKMIEFLRMRKEIKRIEEQRLERLKQKKEEAMRAKRTVSTINANHVELGNIAERNGEVKSLATSGLQQNAIAEDDAENHKDDDDRQRERVQDLVKSSKVHAQKINFENGKNGHSPVNFAGNGGLQMKGIIGRTGGAHVGKTQKGANAWSRLAFEYDLDNIIPKEEQNKPPSKLEKVESELSLGSKFNNYEINSDYSYRARNKSETGPKPVDNEANGEEESGLITSDSDFEVAAQNNGYKHENFSQSGPANGGLSQLGGSIAQGYGKHPAVLRKDVTRIFGGLLKKNKERGIKRRIGDESTQYDGSERKDYDSQTVVSEIERKFQKKKKKSLLTKQLYKEDEVDLRDQYQGVGQQREGMLRTKKEDIRQLEEFISTKKPKDPFKDMDGLQQKVEIKQDVVYHGTSFSDIFEKRSDNRVLRVALEKNKFLQMPKDMLEEEDPDFDDGKKVKPSNLPYQTKIWYQHIQDSSELDESSYNSDNKFAEPQPYETPTLHGFKPDLLHVKTNEVAKRSDIVITSTISINLFPKDKRAISRQYRALMTDQQIQEFVDERCAFTALQKETEYSQFKVRDKDKEFRDYYSKSFMSSNKFRSKTLNTFKTEISRLNSNIKVKKPMTEEQKRKQKLKHEQNKRACERRGKFSLDLETANRFLDGNYFSQSEDEDDGGEADPTQQENQRNFNFEAMQSEFQSEAIRILTADDPTEPKRDEIPEALRKELNLPENMKIYGVNFHEIRRKDASIKKKKPIWSGQDVLPHTLDATSSMQITDQLNAIRVWPQGLYGIWKRIRFVLRVLMNSNFIEGFLTLCVLSNTVTLALDSPSMAPELELTLNSINSVFTWVFIVEMSLKLLAYGVIKYCLEPMNLLDGFVVLLSVFEIIMTSLATRGGGEVNMSSFKALRTLRTFRVFRIARLLRMMKQMQQIVAVLIKSASSIFYITVLMFIGVMIFALLGMSLFGGKMQNADGTPQMNFDAFHLAIATTFQIMTMENWQTILYDMLRGDNFQPMNIYAVVIYLIAWIFMGNFVLLNLFLAILIDAFLEEDDEDGDEDAIMARREAKKARKIARKNKMEQKKVIMVGMKSTQNKNKKFLGGLTALTTHQEEEMDDVEDLDEDVVKQIFKKEGYMAKDPGEEVKIEWFAGIECEQALFLFSKDNSFRRACFLIYQHYWFERVILLMIVLSSVKLGVDTYSTRFPEDGMFAKVSNGLDTFFTWVFIVEAILKIVSMGFLMDEGSYLREAWNQLDGFIVFNSILEMALSSGSSLGVLRMLRVLRALRMISRNPELKQVIVALGESIGQISNVMLVTAIIFLIFAIIGVNLFGGKMNYCSEDMYKWHTDYECRAAGGLWMTYDHNFDNSMKGFVTLFVVASLEGWPDVLMQAYDAPGTENTGPIYNNGVGKAIAFFLLFIVIGSFFFINMFVGVLFLKFAQAQAEQQRGFTKQELDWIEIQGMIESAEPEFTTTNVPKDPTRQWFHRLVTHTAFDTFIIVVILLNMLQMAVEFEGMSPAFVSFLKVCGYGFTAVFFIEMVLKMIGFGWTYFNTGWNRFDFFVVLASMLDIVLLFFNASGGPLASLAQLARVLRVLRVTRILKVISQSEDLLSIMATIQYAVGALLNVFILLMLFFFIFSVLGNVFFQTVSEGEDVVSKQKNFLYFFEAFLLVFATTTGEDWNKVMFELGRQPDDTPVPCDPEKNCGSTLSTPYFMVLVVGNSYIMLNLFILVITQNFEENYTDESNLKMFQNDLGYFMEVWRELTQQRYDCQFIKESQLDQFFTKLGEQGSRTTTLGFNRDIEPQDQKRYMLKMAIRGDNGYVYFNELLYRCMKRKYGPPKMNRRNQIIELSTKYRIFNSIYAKKKINNQMVYDKIININNAYNPFLTRMNYKISFKTWLKHAKAIMNAQNKSMGALLNKMESSVDDSAQPLFYEIAIEVETEIEYTSEEEEPKFASVKKGRSFLNNSIGRLKNNLSGSKRKSVRKTDHLQLFQQKMKASINQSLKQRKSVLQPSINGLTPDAAGKFAKSN